MYSSDGDIKLRILVGRLSTIGISHLQVRNNVTFTPIVLFCKLNKRMNADAIKHKVLKSRTVELSYVVSDESCTILSPIGLNSCLLYCYT